MRNRNMDSGEYWNVSGNLKKQNVIYIYPILITFFYFLMTSCKSKEISEVETTIINEDFIKLRTMKCDSVVTDTFTNKRNMITKYYLKDSSQIIVSRDSLKRITAWWHRNRKGQDIDGAEVSKRTGQILGKLHFVNGALDGAVRYYYEDGRIKTKGQFKNGRWFGEWKNYNPIGKLETIDYYDNEGIKEKTDTILYYHCIDRR